jgi:hypothetical protein
LNRERGEMDDLGKRLREKFKTPLDALLAMGFSREEAMKLTYDEINDRNRGIYPGARDQGTMPNSGMPVGSSSKPMHDQEEGEGPGLQEVLEALADMYQDDPATMNRLNHHPVIGDAMRRWGRRGARDNPPPTPDTPIPGGGMHGQDNRMWGSRGDGSGHHRMAGDSAGLPDFYDRFPDNRRIGYGG